MTVQCPRCRTQYKVPNARISDPRPVFKCTRCSLVFSREADRAPRGAGRGRDDERNLALPFASRKEAPSEDRGADAPERGPRIAGPDDPTVHAGPAEDELDEPRDAEDEAEEEEAEDETAVDEDDDEEAGDEGEDEDDAPEEEDEEEAPPPRRAAAAAPPPKRDERRASRGSDQEPAFVASASRERPPAPPRRDRRRDELRFRHDDEDDVFERDAPELDVEDDEPRRPVLVASEGRQRRAPITPRRGGAAGAPSRSPLRAVVIGVGAITAVYLGLAVALGRQPAAALETLGGVPLLGRLLGGDHLLLWRLQLAGVEGGLDQIKGGRPAYVVSGRAINTSNEDLRIIEIEGRLLVDGVEQRRQVVYAANQPRKTIRDLSPSEVEMLLRLEPNRRFVIRPGESASFLLVFPDPPRDTTEVTCRVVNARTA